MMKVETIVANLERTIAGKEQYLKQLREEAGETNPYAREFKSDGELMALRATIEFVKINIRELRMILIDLKQLPSDGN